MTKCKIPSRDQSLVLSPDADQNHPNETGDRILRVSSPLLVVLELAKHERGNTRNQQSCIIVISKPLQVRDEGVGIPGDGSKDVFGDGGWRQSIF